MREIRVTNSLTQKKEVLKTRTDGKLTMYSCGPTVYGFIHVGNLRAALTADLFYRYFKKVGYDVTYVRNFTDIDDKIINRGKEENSTADAVAKKYISEVEKDYILAGLLEPSFKTKATEFIPEMIEMIEKLISKGHAYVVQGEVLYSVNSFEGYGKLSNRKLEDLQAGARVEIDEKKRNPLDFALWKPAKPGEPFWASPWGNGRPGWHIECSAMSKKHLGDQIDVHHGGVDLVFPHHENEIAQSEGASGKDPFVSYWLHNGFLTMTKEKMSKSLGNVMLAREFLQKFNGEFARALLLGVHYRAQLDFSDESFDQVQTMLERLYEAKLKASELALQKAKVPVMRAESLWGSFAADCDATQKEMDEQFANDFNTAGALGALFTLIRQFNRILDEPQARATPSAAIGGALLLKLFDEELAPVLGVGGSDPARMLSELNRIREMRARASGVAHASNEEVEKLIQARLDARKAKDFKRADEIRAELDSKGVVLKDSPTGTTWSFK